MEGHGTWCAGLSFSRKQAGTITYHRGNLCANNDNFIGGITAFFHHGLILVHDADSNAVHAGWDAMQPVHLDTDSLYLAVRPSVEGPVTVCAYRDEPPECETQDMTLCLDNEFEWKSGFIRVHDPNDSVLLEAQGQCGRYRLRVLVDDPDSTRTTRVVLVLGQPLQ